MRNVFFVFVCFLENPIAKNYRVPIDLKNTSSELIRIRVNKMAFSKTVFH